MAISVLDLFKAAIKRSGVAGAVQLTVRSDAPPASGLGSSAALPEAQAVKKGGSTFDTLNGNVLQR